MNDARPDRQGLCFAMKLVPQALYVVAAIEYQDGVFAEGAAGGGCECCAGGFLGVCGCEGRAWEAEGVVGY